MKAPWVRWSLSFALIVLLVFVCTPVESRRSGGGNRGGGSRGMSRSGPAALGSVRAPRQSTARPQPVPQRFAPREQSRYPVAPVGVQSAATGGETAAVRANQIAGRDQGDRQERREERQDRRDEIRDEAGNQPDDNYDDDHEHYYYYGHSANVYTSLPCAGEAVVVDGVTYWQCGSTWYTRTFSGGDVTYVATRAPAGY